MGEAKRRKKLDASYGKVFSLRTDDQKLQHAAKIMNDFHAEFKKEFLAFGSAKFIPENYSSVVSDMASWLQNNFANYSDSDSGFIALTLLYSGLEFNIEASTSPVFSLCLIDVLSTYLSSEDQTLLKESREDILISLVQEAVEFDDEPEDSDAPVVVLLGAKNN